MLRRYSSLYFHLFNYIRSIQFYVSILSPLFVLFCSIQSISRKNVKQYKKVDNTFDKLDGWRLSTRKVKRTKRERSIGMPKERKSKTRAEHEREDV